MSLVRPTWKRERGKQTWEARLRWEPEPGTLMAVVVRCSTGYEWSAMGTIGWRVSLDDALAAASALLGVPL